ncbi:DNA helicase RecG [Candidatus Marinamargulisbacteria bacterium SCGC AAA071-K20]|nr:DNA helicase RecG [Candidatus Marinamargulisbacteria bacterium SCGC AAA071-K20]
MISASNPVNLSASLQYIKGVGPKLAKHLEKLSIRNVTDFVYYFPRLYDDRRTLPKLVGIEYGENIQAYGRILDIKERKVRPGLTIINCKISDGFGTLSVQWFNQAFLKKVLRVGLWVYVRGKVEFNHFEKETQLSVSEHEFYQSYEELSMNLGAIMPIYGLKAGLYQYQMRKVAKAIFKENNFEIEDPLPIALKRSLNLADLKPSIIELHYPSSRENFNKARTRLVFDEFFYYQLRLSQKRIQFRSSSMAKPLRVEGKLIDAYFSNLEYTLTNAQKRVINEIKGDLSKNTSMNRLVQGDVGSGKTDLAIFSLLCAVETGKIGALMAPTEILVVQHYLKLKKLFHNLDIKIHLLKSKMKAAEKRATVEALKGDKACIVIGTHSLIQGYVELPNLGCVIIDEQHRFGVIQRLELRKKGINPHALFLTATPIPRSFMLTSFGDLEKSIIDELPPGRKAPNTYFINDSELESAYTHCKKRLSMGEQLYIVYPLVEESEKLDLKSAVEGFEIIKAQFQSYTVGLIHGRLKPQEKSEIMKEFKDNKIQILVATTVIEVGIDVPNASMMIIRHAERFGLSQLHQLRGRIGRGGQQSDCFLVGNPKSDSGKGRIKAMVETNDGFKLSEIDLKIRGPGDMLGTKQSGIPDFNLANLIKDESILVCSKQVAEKIIKDDPNLESLDYRKIKKKLMEEHTELLELQLN